MSRKDRAIETNPDAKRVLLVDDDPTFRTVARASLEGAGFLVEEAEHGQAGVSKFEQTRPDIVMLDIRMPVMDGFEACVALRRLPEGQRVPIIMLTGLHDPESVERAYEVGATEFMSKPVNYAILNHRLRRIVSGNRFLIDFDGLTGLPNRARLLSHARRAVAHGLRSRCTVAILFIDIDGFKGLNARLGQWAGDKILCQVAERLGGLRSTDILARNCEADLTRSASDSPPIASVGGDEFIVVLPEVRKAEDCAVVARRIEDLLARPFRVADETVSITASIGISTCPLDGEEPQILLAHAEAAMREAKTKGPGQYSFYRESLNDKARRRLSIETQLREALEREQLELHYQPVMDIQSDRIAGMEALARWPESLESVPPLEFIALAEETGLMGPLGDLVFRTACRQAAEMLRQGLPVPALSINLSRAQFKQKGIAQHLARILSETRLPPSLIELELTEEMLREAPEASIERLTKLREVGFRIALDDFGSGHSSLRDLERFPLDTLKIDPHFVQGLGRESGEAIARAIIELGHALSLRVVAEGVEEMKQLDALRQHGCELAQGFLFSRPLPFDAFVQWSGGREATSAPPVMQTVSDSFRRRSGDR